MRIAIWGTGKTEKSIESYILDSIDIIAFVDNDEKAYPEHIFIIRNGKYVEIPVISPQNVNQFEYDYILIAAADYIQIENQCIHDLHIPKDKILQAFALDLWEIDQIEKFFSVNILADWKNYYIEGRHVWMNREHALPLFQRAFTMYDRFIPFLGEMTKEKEGKYIIDIGANIGDTLMAMWDHINDNYICVEPTELFLNYCKKNAAQLNGNGKIFFEQCFVTDSIEVHYISNIHEGTAVKEELVKTNSDFSSKVPSETLDGLLIKRKIKPEEIDLIKIDTDGFDADCIISGQDVLNKGNALLYWENEIHTYEQYEKYQKAYDVLEKAGYVSYFIFDNFGNYMCMANINILRSLSAYLQRINMEWDKITFDYLDVLACKETDTDICKKLVECYLEKYLLCRKG